ncbi:hypothetical protein E4665_10570 [Sporolactobacillus shoreae]|uniref:ParB/Sulfiredoxin domain-containing protein n=1 Tax=Sporolactobacillus shoreae TaxID=1465501 RepID=A0A4Z0GLH2_9BACL|nr:hypothetical protein [Sporolactobacillus shoreae]TGA97833.1 hypothetical protein E4665_10570 [Sporolactobacillus shoreae]
MQKFFLDLYQIRPSQLYLDQSEIERAETQFNPINVRNNLPLPVKKIGGEVFLTGGHVRAYLYDHSQISLIPVYWDGDEPEEELFKAQLKWCREEMIMFVSDLQDRILPHDEYLERWVKRCEAESEKLKKGN